MQGDYLRKSQLAKEYAICRQTVYEYVKGIKEQIKLGRYSPYAVAEPLVNRYVFIDYLTYKDRLKDKNMAKYVPPFNPRQIMELIQEEET